MTRIRQAPSGSLPAIFRLLGRGPTNDELDLTATALRRDDAILAAFEEANDLNGEAFERLVEIAEQSGSSAFVALDLVESVLSGSGALRRAGRWARPPQDTE